MPDSGLEELVTLHSLTEAQILAGALAAAGVRAHVFDAGIASLIGPGVSGIRVMVAAEDLARARLCLPG
jgi:hypothetical protein